jgi:hypothetical protein
MTRSVPSLARPCPAGRSSDRLLYGEPLQPEISRRPRRKCLDDVFASDACIRIEVLMAARVAPQWHWRPERISGPSWIYAALFACEAAVGHFETFVAVFSPPQCTHRVAHLRSSAYAALVQRCMPHVCGQM